MEPEKEDVVMTYIYNWYLNIQARTANHAWLDIRVERPRHRLLIARTVVTTCFLCGRVSTTTDSTLTNFDDSSSVQFEQ